MKQDKIKILKNIFGPCRVQGEEHLFGCPYCKHHKRKLSINVQNNVFKCWVCDARGKNVRRLIRRFGGFNDLSRWDSICGVDHSSKSLEDLFFEEQPEEQRQYIDLPESFHTLTRRKKTSADLPAYNYLLNRGLTDKDILKYKIGYCTAGPYKNRIIIPSFDKDGYLNYFIARSYIGDKMKYKNPNVSRDIVFNELNVDWDSDIVITEGIFDAINTSNGVPILGSTLRETSRLFQNIVMHDSSVFIALDPDAERKAMNMISNFLKYDIEVWKMDIPHGQDLGSLSRKECEKIKEEAYMMNHEGYYLERQIMSI
tara:strand:+ start:899 stop:1837 length:939 start_codon:yes stop_codon:yes gene_type:complete